MKLLYSLIAATVSLAGISLAQGNRAPVKLLPPGQVGKTSPADFEQRTAKQLEREQRLLALQDRLEDSAAEREAKRLERLAIEAAILADQVAAAQVQVQAPVAPAGTANKVVTAAGPQSTPASVAVVQQTPAAAAAPKVVARRTR